MVDNEKYLALLKQEENKSPLYLKKLKSLYLERISYLRHSNPEAFELESEILNQEFNNLNFNMNKILSSPFFNLLVIPIIGKCNLNCKGCDAYAPLCDSHEDIYQVSQLQKDMDELSKKGIGIKEISIEGGEPFLHPELETAITIIRNAFPKLKRLTVLTNGLLLSNYSPEFFRHLKALDCGIVIDKYFESDVLDRNLKMLSDLGMEYELDGCVSGTGWFHRAPLNLSTSVENESALFHFTQCEKANNIFTLDRGYIYSCGRSASIKYFNRYFNLNLPDEGIDIYNNSGEEITKKLSTPKQLCKYCLPITQSHMDWEESSKDIQEWAEI